MVHVCQTGYRSVEECWKVQTGQSAYKTTGGREIRLDPNQDSLYPLDNRFCYYSSVRPLWNEPRPELIAQRPDDEPFFITRRFAERPKEGCPATVTTALPDYHLLRPNAVAIPMRLRVNPSPESSGPQTGIAFGQEHATSANLSKRARAYLASLTSVDPDIDEELSPRPLAACFGHYLRAGISQGTMVPASGKCGPEYRCQPPLSFCRIRHGSAVRLQPYLNRKVRYSASPRENSGGRFLCLDESLARRSDSISGSRPDGATSRKTKV